MELRAAAIDAFVTDLASRDPVPGGGAVAGLLSAFGASLASMVANFSTGQGYESASEDVERVLSSCAELIERSLTAAEEDAVAFRAVTDAYRLPRETDAEKETRTAEIQAALRAATDVPLRAADLAAASLPLCRELLDYGNRNVLSDVGVAAACIRAAIDSALINIAINAKAIKDEEYRTYLQQRMASARSSAAEAANLVRAVEATVSA